MRLWFISHPEVVIDPTVPVPRWHLAPHGIARMRTFLADGALDTVRSVWASDEAKAIEAAGLAAARLGLPVRVHPGLRENDRSATGFLPPPEFGHVVDRFFAEPEVSARGWERAIDAQARIISALAEIIPAAEPGDIAIIAHGGIGTLALCHFLGVPIARSHDQPFQGHVWCLDRDTHAVVHAWRAIAPR